MSEQETVDKARIFFYNLANSEVNSGQTGTNSLLDLLLRRAMKRDSKDIDAELKKFIQNNQLIENRKIHEKVDLVNDEVGIGKERFEDKPKDF